MLNEIGGWGVTMSRPAGRTNDDYAKIARQERYAEHRRELREAGHDPDFIGTTEVKPVCCGGCGKPIPWRTLRGWQD
jgi:hypothetical protein